MKLILLAVSLLTFAHWKERPELDHWFEGLTSSTGAPCCSGVDGSTVADVDWDTTIVEGKAHYRVRIEGQWIVVTDQEVVQAPNKAGPAIAWVYHIDGKPQIRCFLPGARV